MCGSVREEAKETRWFWHVFSRSRRASAYSETKARNLGHDNTHLETLRTTTSSPLEFSNFPTFLPNNHSTFYRAMPANSSIHHLIII
ncbi:hypothetical protein HBI42_104460 [Parastagonospora nodorum]|nr:hypothetical protein HBI43_104820 [Parastagonospora nodorum]KAH6257846.1 hypothetical protein HBI42_104460 [Parastagonospora nodorum]